MTTNNMIRRKPSLGFRVLMTGMSVAIVAVTAAISTERTEKHSTHSPAMPRPLNVHGVMPDKAASGNRPRPLPTGPSKPEIADHAQERSVRRCQWTEELNAAQFTAAQPRCGVDCRRGHCGDGRWADSSLIPWDVFAQGEYVGPARLPHVHEYRLRVDDLLDFVFRLTGSVTPGSYRFNVGDVIRVESLTAEELAHPEVIVEPDGMITLRMLGPVRAAGRTSQELRTNLDELYKQNGFEDPTMTVTPVKLNTTLEELRATIDSRYGAGGQQRQSRVTPEGTIQLPALGSVPVQGLTLDELKRELNHRYQELVQGIEITPILVQRAPRFIYVVGEVRAPGRYVLEGPTSVVQSIALAGGWNVGGNLHQVVIFRRTEDWNLLATRLDLHGALLGKRPCPASEIWLRDTDIVIVPKQKILVFNEFVHLVFTHGVYGVIPLNTSYSFDRVGRL